MYFWDKLVEVKLLGQRVVCFLFWNLWPTSFPETVYLFTLPFMIPIYLALKELKNDQKFIYLFLPTVPFPLKWRLQSFVLTGGYVLLILKRGREGGMDREINIHVREKHWQVASYMRPDQGPNPKPLGAWEDAPTHWTNRPGQYHLIFAYKYRQVVIIIAQDWKPFHHPLHSSVLTVL